MTVLKNEAFCAVSWHFYAFLIRTPSEVKDQRNYKTLLKRLLYFKAIRGIIIIIIFYLFDLSYPPSHYFVF